MTVPDIEAALDWYESVLGFERVVEPTTVEPDEGHMGRLCADVLGDFERGMFGRHPYYTPPTGGGSVVYACFAALLGAIPADASAIACPPGSNEVGRTDAHERSTNSDRVGRIPSKNPPSPI